MHRVAKSWLIFSAAYVAFTSVLNLVWELVQLPLYTIWKESPLQTSILAALHCTLGDLLIAAWTVLLSILLVGRGWPNTSYVRVGVSTVVLALAYAIFSEWWNVEVRQTWAYSPLMPRLPFFGTGLSPLLQWMIVPTLSFALLHWLPRHGSSVKVNEVG